MQAPSSLRTSGGDPSVGNLGRPGGWGWGGGKEGYSSEKSRSPSFVSAFFHHFPRGTDPTSDSSNSCLEPQTPASTCGGCCSYATHSRGGDTRLQWRSPRRLEGWSSPPTHTPGDDTDVFLKCQRPFPTSGSPHPSPRLCRNGATTTAGEKTWCHHHDHG